MVLQRRVDVPPALLHRTDVAQRTGDAVLVADSVLDCEAPAEGLQCRVVIASVRMRRTDAVQRTGDAALVTNCFLDCEAPAEGLQCRVEVPLGAVHRADLVECKGLFLAPRATYETQCLLARFEALLVVALREVSSGRFRQDFRRPFLLTGQFQ